MNAVAIYLSLLFLQMTGAIAAEKDGEQNLPASIRQQFTYLRTEVWPKLPYKERKVAEDSWNSLWLQYQTPIEFSGKIISEEGSGVGKVKIEITVFDDSERGWTIYKKISDSQGRFKLEGVNGKYMAIRMFNPDYYMSRKNRLTFDFSDPSNVNYLESDRKEPFIFRARKRGQSDALIASGEQWKIPIDGTEVGIDLAAGSIISNSLHYNQRDLIVRYVHPKGNKNDQSDWKLFLEVPGNIGGLIISEDEYMFQAPKEGYSKSIVVNENRFFDTNGDGRSLYLYLCSREGKYFARMKVDFKPLEKVGLSELDRKTMFVGLLKVAYFLNPNASTNLEYEVGNNIVSKTMYGDGVELVYPDPESLKGIRKVILNKNSFEETDEIERWRDFFPTY